MRPLLIVLAALGLVAAVLGGCSGTRPDDGAYPQRYLDALQTFNGVPAQDAHFDPFVNFVTHMSAPDWQERFASVYADELHFSDTLTVIGDRATLESYFAGLHEAEARTTVRILARQTAGADAYLIWEMQSEFKPIVGTRTSHSIGVTHLRFNEQGKVVLHQDFWDSAQGFYQHLPLVGPAIRGIRSRLQPDV